MHQETRGQRTGNDVANCSVNRLGGFPSAASKAIRYLFSMKKSRFLTLGAVPPQRDFTRKFGKTPDTPHSVICSNEDRNWLQRTAINSNLNSQIRA
jgi:hypothetical protein